jgi:hypothetical protein
VLCLASLNVLLLCLLASSPLLYFLQRSCTCD